MTKISKEEEYFHNPNNWDNVMIIKEGYAWHGYRICTYNMTEEEQNILCDELDKKKIEYEERDSSSIATDTVPKGARNIRITDPESVKKLQEEFFSHPKENEGLDHPIKEPIMDYYARQAREEGERDKIKETFVFNDPTKWDDVSVISERRGVRHNGHRINIQNMSDKAKDLLLYELESIGLKIGENVIERQATLDSPPLIKKGDLTLRIVEPKAVKMLRKKYFKSSKETFLPVMEICRKEPNLQTTLSNGGGISPIVAHAANIDKR